MAANQIFRLLLVCVVLFAGSETQAARSHRRGRSHRSSAASRVQRYVRARQQQMQRLYAQQRQALARQQQLLAQQRAQKLAIHRQASQLAQKRAEESRERRLETVRQQFDQHKREAEAAGTTHGSPEELLKNYDKDGDGRLSQAEVRGSPLSLQFRDADTNRDGLLTIDEIRSVKRFSAGKPTATGKPMAKGT